LDYAPTGKQTSLSPINCVASASLTPGNYLIRKYSYFLVDNVQYTFIKDTPFEKSTSETEDIGSINTNSVLYQGVVGEYPTYTAEGKEYETLPVVVDNLVSTKDTRFISHGTISVYVKESDTGKWYEYDEVDTLFTSSSTDRVFSLRLNENGHYEVKFGNGVFGRLLQEGEDVSVFYILSDGQKGLISKNAIDGNKLFVYNSNLFSMIYSDVGDSVADVIDNTNNTLLTFTNPSNSTLIQEAETVAQMRDNVPYFTSQAIALGTEKDYEKFLMKTIPNILNDVRVVGNDVFISDYIDYFYKICVDPNKVNRVILNQVNFADSCDFNNVNVFCVPSFSTTDEQYPNFLNNSFKTLIKDLTRDRKTINHEVVPRDPIYMALDFGFSNSTPTKNVYSDTKLVVYREKNDKTSKETIKKRVADVIVSYFAPESMSLGQTIDISELSSSILSVSGVKNVKTKNTKDNIWFNGVSFIMWNPMFENVDESFVNQTTSLPFFKFPYLYRPVSLINRIEVIDE